MKTPFLTAEWRHLVMLNYEIDAEVLRPFVPAGTELDLREGRAFVSMVGFMFRKTRVRGWAIPFHCNFEEVNLRFYVKREVGGELRRGVVFIKELVPRLAIAWTARTFYNENYVALPMCHEIDMASEPKRVAYTWLFEGRKQELEVSVSGESGPIAPGSNEEFITEHYWGYARQRDGGTVEYKVEHPQWRVWTAQHSEFHCHVAKLYGKPFVPFLQGTPDSAFLAEGSAVKVYGGERLETGRS